MGDAADMLMDAEQEHYDLHVTGMCRDWCHYCEAKHVHTKKLINEMDVVEERDDGDQS